MKLKSIIWIALATFITFSACNQEDPISPCEDVKDGIPTTLNITVSTEGVTTKADLADTTPAAETKINTLAIAVFKKEGTVVGERLDFKYITSLTKEAGADDFATHEGRDVYTINNLKIQTGSIQILAIANSTLVGENLEGLEDLDAAMTIYADAKDYLIANKGLKEGVAATEYTFKSSELVKFADTEFKEIALTTKNLHLELTQLAARVDVSFKVINVKPGENWVYTINKFEVDGIQYSSDIFLASTTTAANSCDVAPNGTYSYQLEPGAEKDTYLSKFTFYSYERLTKAAPINVSVYGYLKDPFDKNSEDKNYKFTINPNVPEHGTAGLIHGHLYDVVGQIDQQTKSITFDVQIVDWEDRTIPMDANILYLDYLFVKEHDIKMPNINSYKFDYASNLPVRVDVVYAYYKEYKKDDGTSENKPYGSGADQYPRVVPASDGTFEILFSDTPNNYSPTYIMLNVYTVGASLSETVMVTHYPSLYVEGVLNNEKNGAVPDDLRSKNPKANHNLFTVTTIAADGYMVGDPRDVSKKSKTDYESNQLVSPQFVIASQWGVWSVETYANAQTRCTKYMEGPYQTEGEWRIPTMGEIEIINRIQWDPASAISKLLQGESYWSACQYYYYAFSSEGGTNTGDFVGGDSSSKTFIRCVHDVY